MARRPKRWREVVAGSGDDDLSAMARLMEVMVEMVSSARPPSVSATKGTKSVPEERQAERLEASLRWTPTCRAWPGVRAASATVRTCSGLITCTSRAAGRPRLQLGRKTSAGRACEPGTRPGASLEGARAADWAAEKMTSLMALWRAIKISICACSALRVLLGAISGRYRYSTCNRYFKEYRYRYVWGYG